jgi:hypothetical protein
MLIVVLVGQTVHGLSEPSPPAKEPQTAYRPVPINMAEAIIEPFWSPDLSGFAQWTVRPGLEHGLKIKQNWSAVDFEWASKPTQGPALHMSRAFNIDSRGYDRLLVRLTAPKQSVLHILAITELGRHSYTSKPESENGTEHVLELQGARLIKILTLEIRAQAEGPGTGWLRWIGLQNSEQLARYHARWDYSQMQWDAHIKDARQISSFKPRYGIFLNDEELAGFRAQHQEAIKTEGQSRYTQEVLAARACNPEEGVHEFVNSGGAKRSHSRVRDQFQAPLSGSPDLAIAGLVLQDAEALRMAARYALCLALSEHWDTGFMSHLPGSPWEDRAFRRSYTAEDIAMILDLAGAAFTDTGRNYLMRRLAEEGVGPINYVAWRHEYIFHCNQLAYFNTGRMYAYLVLEQAWPRVKPYTDLAYKDAVNNLGNVIQADGGSLEGPGYFNPIARENYKAIKYYARSRNQVLSELIPKVLKMTAQYAAVVSSTTADDVIPVCDSGAYFRSDTLSVLTQLMPQSHWTSMYNKLLLREGKPPLAQTGPPLPAYIALPDTGYLASHRSWQGQPVKLLIMGHKAGADHTHEDKGSFVLEFAGQTFALDLGICDYDDPIHAVYKHCQRHNMLVPVGLPERAHPQRPLPVDVKPTGHGDETVFHARIDATPGWGAYYRKWHRSWDSPSPDTLIIRDEYALAQGKAVAFYWQTRLPVQQQGQSVLIEGKAGKAIIEVPSDCTIHIDRLALAEGQAHHRIAIYKTGAQGILELRIHLRATAAQQEAELRK